MESATTSLRGSFARPARALRLTSDARLAKLAASGDEGAMAAIFERHHQALYRYCHSIVGNGHDAADALQNTMVKVLRALPGETRQIALRPWLYRIAHNESISLLRARHHDSDLDAAAQVSDEAAAGLVGARQQLRSLTEDLAELTERQRGALLMREVGGLEFAEIAHALGTSASAVKQSVYEARCALQAMQEGRAMDCETVRRTLSDGDRRVLRGVRLRGHLRACAGCHAFEVALRERPAQLTAMVPPLPVAAGAAMLNGLFGGGGMSGGGGLAGGIAVNANAAAGFSLGTKAVAVAVSATLAGGAVYTIPGLGSAGAPKRSPPQADTFLRSAAPQRQTPARAGTQDQSTGAGRGASRAGAFVGERTSSGTRQGAGAGTPAPALVAKPAATPEAGTPTGAGGCKRARAPKRAGSCGSSRKAGRKRPDTAAKKPRVRPKPKRARKPPPRRAERSGSTPGATPAAAKPARTPPPKRAVAPPKPSVTPDAKPARDAKPVPGPKPAPDPKPAADAKTGQEPGPRPPEKAGGPEG